MADISAWSPVDESNTAAPPHGWPEHMAANAVNNSARALMGAVRRWYDTVTAQLASVTASLGNYLPLAGGTVTGGLHVGGTLSGDGNITAGGGITAGTVTTAGNITAGGQVQAGYLHSTGDILAGDRIDAAGTVSALQLSVGAINATGNITASTGTVTAADVVSPDAHFDHCIVSTNIDCDGIIDAHGYTKDGLPVVFMAVADLMALEARIAALEARP